MITKVIATTEMTTSEFMGECLQDLNPLLECTSPSVHLTVP